ncbi:MAG: CBS domain-containing protein [Deltaproteobacteria bacterium]|nr:CBS domain-containing protein [Deltaproteobacteria bacterium]
MSITVAELMTDDVVTLPADATIGEAMGVLAETERRHLPILDEGRVIGMLSDRDLRRIEGLMALAVEEPAKAQGVLDQPAAELLSGDPVTINGDAPVVDAIDILVRERVGALLVVDGAGMLTGMLSYIDILEAARASFE